MTSCHTLDWEGGLTAICSPFKTRVPPGHWQGPIDKSSVTITHITCSSYKKNCALDSLPNIMHNVLPIFCTFTYFSSFYSHISKFYNTHTGICNIRTHHLHTVTIITLHIQSYTNEREKHPCSKYLLFIYLSTSTVCTSRKRPHYFYIYVTSL